MDISKATNYIMAIEKLYNSRLKAIKISERKCEYKQRIFRAVIDMVNQVKSVIYGNMTL